MSRLSAQAIYAIGAAVAGILAVGLAAALLALTGSFHDDYYYSFTIFVLGVAPAGWVCGWLGWRRLIGSPPLSAPRALAIAATTSVSALIIAGILGWVLFFVLASLSGRLERQAFNDFLETLLSGLLLGPLYATVVFGIPFSALIVAWTFWRRRAVNRSAKP